MTKEVKQEQDEPVCDKDPRGCWSISCQLDKKCKNTPQTKEWVGLTDDEIFSIIGDPIERNFLDVDDWEINEVKWVEFTKAIEAKLKEKNT